VDSGARRDASYTNLAPGNYTFRVIACNDDGLWNEAGAAFSFHLDPHFYQTAWFYALLALAAGLIGLGGYQLRVRQMRKGFRAVLAERARLAREIHDTLAQGFVAIGLQLNAVADKLIDSPELALEHLELADKLVRRNLIESRRTVWELRQQALEGGSLWTALSEAANQMARGRPVKIDLQTRGTPRDLPVTVESNLLRIGQEAMANAITHARPTSVLVELSFAPTSVGLRVKDDGRGFEVEGAIAAGNGHFGLVGIAERVEQLGGELVLNSSPGRGTEVLVNVPLK